MRYAYAGEAVSNEKEKDAPVVDDANVDRMVTFMFGRSMNTTISPEARAETAYQVALGLTKLEDGEGMMEPCNPDVPVNCPLCGARLVYLKSVDGTHVYRCSRHGELMLPPDGRVRQVPA